MKEKVLGLLALLYSAIITLKISVITLVQVYRGTFRRDIGDHRLRYWSSRLLELARANYTICNPYHVQFELGKRYIVMSNHNSYYDIPLIFLALPGSIRMLAKAELFRVPVWGSGMRVGEFVSVNRRNTQQAIKDLQVAREKMESGIILWISPEGTRSRTNNLGIFKKGGFMLALETGASIVPVGIRGAREIMPPGTWICRFGKQVEVHIGQPIDITQYDLQTRDQLMEDVEMEIRQLAGLDVGEQAPSQREAKNEPSQSA